MSLEQKIEILNNEKIPQVYEAGKKSMIDESKIIEKTANSIDLLNLKDVSEIPHNVGVQLTSDTITDFSNVGLTVVGKNLWDKEYASDKNNWGVLNNSYSSIAIYVGKGNAVTFSYKNILATGLNFFAAVMTKNTTADSVTTWLYHNTMSGSIRRILTIQATEDYIYLRMTHAYFSQFMEYIGNDLQIEIGSTATEYEPYKSKIYTPTSDGVVNASSISPVMNMYVDETDVNISANYYKSYGIQAEYDRFWDNYQDCGTRGNYDNAFSGEGWNTELFKPKYNITPTSAYMICRRNKMNIDLVEYLENLGIELDFSKCTNFQFAFHTSSFTRLGIVDARSSTTSSSLDNTFYNSTNLVTIDKIILNENATKQFASTFNVCNALENVEFEGEIKTNDLNLQWSTKLSKASIINIFEHLSPTTSGLKITLSKTAVNDAFDIDVGDETTYPEGSEYYTLRHSKDNWTISYL